MAFCELKLNFQNLQVYTSMTEQSVHKTMTSKLENHPELKERLVKLATRLYNYRDCKNRNKFKFGILFKYAKSFDDQRRSSYSKIDGSTQIEYINNNVKDDGDLICHIYGKPKNCSQLISMVSSMSGFNSWNRMELKEDQIKDIGVYEYRDAGFVASNNGSFRLIINFTKSLWTFGIYAKECTELSWYGNEDNDTCDPANTAYLEWKDKNIEQSNEYISIKKEIESVLNTSAAD